MRRFLPAFLLLAGATALPGCFGSSTTVAGSSDDPFNPTGHFIVEGTNILDGMTWELNRPIRIEFNHPVNPNTIDFGTIQIRAVNPRAVPNPVTGTFEIEPGTDGRSVIFRPTCPTNNANSNGAFLGGGHEYQLLLPTKSQTPTVLRDTEGRPLDQGLKRTFRTPLPAQPQFLDLVEGPPVITGVEYPEGLNLFSDPDPTIRIHFNQSVDARDTNLNTNNLYLLFADGEIGTANEDVFPSTNVLPGRLVLIENCAEGGAVVDFVISGVLPVNRKIRLEMSAQFKDLVGQRNVSLTRLTPFETPTLAEVYEDPTWNESDETVDEIFEDYDDGLMVDLDAEVPLPVARLSDGFVSAEFDFPGQFVSEDVDFYLGPNVSEEIFTDDDFAFTDSNQREHTLQDGVLNVNDFTISSGATLRGRGDNPLVVYATGTVTIEGTINVSGNNSNWPTSLNSPQFPEGGAAGECGGGRGGDASQIGTAETPRAEAGDAPFGTEGGGGQGGEGGFNQDGAGTGNLGLLRTIVGGGGGGGFARTRNVAILWDDWTIGTGWSPSGVDNRGPDHESRHTAVPSDWEGLFGAESGMRGSSADNNVALPTAGFHGVYGMEDVEREPMSTTEDTSGNVDPAWTSGTEPPFDYGHPTRGPDPGNGGPSVFLNDGNLMNDFWGRRLNNDGTVTEGELLTPWAGSGGGGAGDSMLIERYDFDGDGADDPLASLYPVVPFTRSLSSTSRGWDSYRKGAAGGGGGGQLLIMAIGEIVIGSAGTIKANGGVGFTSESLIYTDQGVSGSGGGSGGHVVLHSATGLDLSAINVGSGPTFADLDAEDNIQAFGGRRGWAGPQLSGHDDGNDTFMIGRGGAGANGVIQIHVPNPLSDIQWHPSAESIILAHIGNPLDVDALEEALGLYTAPQAYSLIPFFSSSSMIQSEWIDTGLAGLRLSANQTPGNWDYPDYRNPLLDFSGIFPSTGLVAKTGGDTVAQLPEVATGPTGAVTFDVSSMVIPQASTYFAAQYLRSPNVLVGYDVLPSASGQSTFQVVAADYERGSDTLTLTTRIADGPLSFAVDPGNPTWSVREKFFRIETGGVKDSLPESAEIVIEFQGTNEEFPGTNEPDENDPIPGVNQWTSNLNDLTGARFIRYRITFEADALDEGIGLASPLPLVDYVKIPFVW